MAKDLEKQRARNRQAMARKYATPEGRERLKANARRWRESKAGKESISLANKHRRRADPAGAMLKSLVGRAGREGIEVLLTREQVDRLLLPMRCSATGLPLSWVWDGPGKNPWAPSLDRLEAGGPYSLENVRVVCWIFNLARSNWSDDTVRKMAEGLITNG